MRVTPDPRPVFGKLPAGVVCRVRHAAYVVVRRSDGSVASVGHTGRRFLPGGGRIGDERPEATVAREIEEELGRRLRRLRRIGEAVQYFYASEDGCWYEMNAVFFSARFEGEPLPSRE